MLRDDHENLAIVNNFKSWISLLEFNKSFTKFFIYSNKKGMKVTRF